MNNEINGNKALNVAVIGAGLVGSLCACYLARQGHNVFVYEYRDDIRLTQTVQGRSINLALSARGRAALSKIGLEHTIISAHGLPMEGRMIHGKKGSKYPIPYDVVNNQCILSVNRKYMNEQLLLAAESHPNVKISFNTKLVSLSPKEGTMTFLRNGTNEPFTTSADLIIGADGAYSTVRKEMLKYPLINFSQEYIEHGYKELHIPPGNNGQSLLESNYLHIWPRSSFMMIALPNQDRSWTVTLFMPVQKFTELNTPDNLLQFFSHNFPDALELITENRLVSDYFSTSPSHLISIKCNPFHLENKVLIIGDAAHAMVPFYGQGMNAGFEDCFLLDKLMTKFHNNLDYVLPEFSKLRCPDAEAICDLAMYNYVEKESLGSESNMENYVRSVTRYPKKLDNILYKLLSNYWLPLYNSVTFTDMSYKQCIENKKFQDKVVWSATMLVIGAVIFMLLHFL